MPTGEERSTQSTMHTVVGTWKAQDISLWKNVQHNERSTRIMLCVRETILISKDSHTVLGE